MRTAKSIERQGNPPTFQKTPADLTPRGTPRSDKSNLPDAGQSRRPAARTVCSGATARSPPGRCRRGFDGVNQRSAAIGRKGRPLKPLIAAPWPPAVAPAYRQIRHPLPNPFTTGRSRSRLFVRRISSQNPTFTDSREIRARGGHGPSVPARTLPGPTVWQLIASQRYNRISYSQACGLRGAIDVTARVRDAARW